MSVLLYNIDRDFQPNFQETINQFCFSLTIDFKLFITIYKSARNLHNNICKPIHTIT